MIKRDFLDKAVSDAVRASWAMCAHCLTTFDRQKNGSWTQKFHCSHFHGRASGNSTRYHPDNLTALCAGCHKLFGDDPGEHVAFIKKIMGDVRYDALRVRKSKVMKYTKADKKAMASWYRDETRRIMALRDQGETGYISLVSWD